MVFSCNSRLSEKVWRTPTLKKNDEVRFWTSGVLILSWDRSGGPSAIFWTGFKPFFLMGCHAGVTPIVNGVKKRTPLLGGVNTKKRGGTGVDVSIRHSTPLPPSLGLGRGKGEIHRGSNYFVFCLFCDNMLFFRVRKKEKKNVATYPGHRWFFLTSPSQDWHFDERVFRLVKIYEKNACMEKKYHARTLPHTGHVKNSDEGSPDFVVGQSFLECVVFFIFKALLLFLPRYGS